MGLHILLPIVNMLFGGALVNEVWSNHLYLSHFRKTNYFLLLCSLIKLRSEVKYNEYTFFIINGWLLGFRTSELHLLLPGFLYPHIAIM
jgi:hypothetical protein